jgi:Protein of unknown function (DUF3618)
VSARLIIVSRSPEQIQREIESSRAQLAATLDQLAEKTSPKRLAGVARARATELAMSPPGISVLGAVGLLVALGIARKVRNARKS